MSYPVSESAANFERKLELFRASGSAVLLEEPVKAIELCLFEIPAFPIEQLNATAMCLEHYAPESPKEELSLILSLADDDFFGGTLSKFDSADWLVKFEARCLVLMGSQLLNEERDLKIPRPFIAPPEWPQDSLELIRAKILKGTIDAYSRLVDKLRCARACFQAESISQILDKKASDKIRGKLDLKDAFSMLFRIAKGMPDNRFASYQLLFSDFIFDLFPNVKLASSVLAVRNEYSSVEIMPQGMEVRDSLPEEFALVRRYPWWNNPKELHEHLRKANFLKINARAKQMVADAPAAQFAKGDFDRDPRIAVLLKELEVALINIYYTRIPKRVPKEILIDLNTGDPFYARGNYTPKNKRKQSQNNREP